MQNDDANPIQPQPDDLVLLNAQQMFENLVHKTLELQRRVEAQETKTATQQVLIDTLNARLAAVESLFGKGTVQ